MRPLEGYTVVDLTTFVAAPVCARLLSDMGARVIKIEPPKGDGWRGSGLTYAPGRFTREANPVFDLYNSGKDMICLNLKSAEGMAVMHQLLEKADIFVTNNRPAALSRLGLHYDQLREKYPKLIYGIVLGFGEKGPDADKPAFDTTAFWARSGFLRDTAVVGESDYNPVEAPSSVGDSYTGTNLAMQILAAVLQRQQTGLGQYVRASLYQIGAFAMGTMILKGQHDDMPKTRWDARPTAAAFQCGDGEWIFLSGVTPERLFELAGEPEKAKDPMWDPANLANTKKERYQAMVELVKTKSLNEWLALIDPLGTPTVRLAHFGDVAKDEQAWANGFVENVTYPNGMVDVVPAIPLHMSGMERPQTQVTRRLGQDTARVLSELGYTQEEIEKMSADGAVLC